MYIYIEFESLSLDICCCCCDVLFRVNKRAQIFLESQNCVHFVSDSIHRRSGCWLFGF
uniref:Uncharacterized protein n=1 Tax=Rhizophora mucronata TaxID=61149 RepID=A0A2P2KF97_RHIMU